MEIDVTRGVIFLAAIFSSWTRVEGRRCGSSHGMKNDEKTSGESSEIGAGGGGVHGSKSVPNTKHNFVNREL